MAISLTDFIKQAQAQQPTATAGGYDLSHLKRSPMELLIMQQAMAQKADAKTLAGFALGKLLRGLFDDWKSRYDTRGVLNEIKSRKEEDQAAALANLEKTDPQQYRLAQGYINEDGSKWASLRQNPPDVSGINQSARAVQQAPAKLLGDTNWAQEPWTDKANWDKWKTLTNVGGWGSGL